MNSASDDSVTRLASQADAVGRLAQDTGGFSAVFAAFGSGDPNAFRWVLDRLELLPYCELICEWVRIKLCALRCVEVCGPPLRDEEIPSLRDFAQAAMRLSSNEKLLRRAVDAVSCGDADAYHAIISELKLVPYCRLLCQWICSVGYRRICHLVCRPGIVAVSDAASELAASGKELSALLENRKALDAIEQFIIEPNCERLQTAIKDAEFAPRCHTICLFLCIWRRVWVCHTLCVEPPPILTGLYAVEEAQKFALAVRQLAGQPRALADLASAVQARDAEAFSGIVARYRLWPYCWQLCAWVTSVTCHELCFCVCPPVKDHPWFTNVGDFNIAPGADIDTTTGLTLHKANGHGGPNFAFFGNLSLGGFCPANHPVTNAPMAYRFLYQPAGAPKPTPIATSYVYGVNGTSGVMVGYRNVLWHGNPNTLQKVYLTGTGTTSPTPPPYSPSPTPPDHYIVPDADGWVTVDPNALGGVFDGYLMGFASYAAFPGGAPPSVPAGNAVTTAKNGANAAIIFQATRVSTIAAVNGGGAPDYTNQLDTIHINNWSEVNALNFSQFATGCCTPIDKTLDVEFTVDHEQMAAGAWSLVISSCALPSDLDITPTASSLGPPPVTVSPQGGYGTVEVDTSGWCNCSYTVALTTRPGLTDGLIDRSGNPNPLTFAICNHKPC
ncbi:MAG TPA: hypothetical protein VHB45_15195 [Alloacidobacterium sp.]|nr:hypothetical protein [Alloacidobacterium sp.]